MSSVPGSEVPLLEEDLECAICMSLLTDPFVTPCGHTFCHSCVSTHLQTGKTCPSCASPLAKDRMFPNFLLSKVLKKVQKNSRGGKPSAFESMQRLLSEAKSSLSVLELESLHSQLAGYKKEAEEQEKDGNMELLLHFLQHSREEKVRKLESLRRELACLDSDIGKVGTVPTDNGGGGGVPAPPTTAVEPLPSPTAAQTQAGAAAAAAMQQAALATIQQQQQQQTAGQPPSTSPGWPNQPHGSIAPSTWPQQTQPQQQTAPAGAPGMAPGAAAAAAAAAAVTAQHHLGSQFNQAAYGMLPMHPGLAAYASTQQQQQQHQNASRYAPVRPPLNMLPSPLPLLGDPSTSASGEAAMGALRNKRRRIASQFEDLQHAYLRLRAARGADAGPTPAAPSGDGDGEAPAVPREGAVDDGLKEFSRILSVLTRRNKLRMLAEIPRPSLRQTSSIISSVEFDRDGSMFATAGVSKRISVFDHASVVGTPGTVVHCPVVELVTRSKLSCLSWNRYVASHLASSDYEGVVTLWDVSTSGMVQEWEAHSKRIWSVDFCGADPTLLASGSDDCAVKLWSTRAPASLAQIDVKANVCSVEWRPGSAHELAVGAADHSVHVYDLRRPAAPVTTISGHQKAVSYVRWCGENELVSASTDSTLRLWDIAAPRGALPERVFEGHTNEKNFVGLAVEGDFLACGSETHEVFVYYKPLSKPVARLAFAGTNNVMGGGEDPAGGAEDDKTFISAVCWRPGGEELLVANSYGTVRVLQLTGGGG